MARQSVTQESKTIRCAIYARVSTKDKGQEVENQLRQLREFASQQAWQIGREYVDRETGSRWDITGRAVEGKLKGWTLTWLDGTQVKWYAWDAEYPKAPVLVQSPQDP